MLPQSLIHQKLFVTKGSNDMSHKRSIKHMILDTQRFYVIVCALESSLFQLLVCSFYLPTIMVWTLQLTNLSNLFNGCGFLLSSNFDKFIEKWLLHFEYHNSNHNRTSNVLNTMHERNDNLKLVSIETITYD